LAGLAIAFALLLWNPDTRKIVGKSLKWIVSIAILAGLGVWAYVSYEDYRYQKRDAPTDNPELAGVKLGDTRKDVLHKKGEPKNSTDDSDTFESATIFYKDNNVSSIYSPCGPYSSAKLNGIACSDYEERLKNRFKGEMYCRPDTPTERIFMVEEFNSLYVLEQEKVVALGVMSGTGKKWIACD
jgi:hypothetical protein